MNSFYLLTLDGLRYGVWKDKVELVRNVENIHQLPFSPEYIAGLAKINDRKTALADLSALIGLTSFNRDLSGHALLVTGREKETGFIFSGAIEEVSVPSDSIHAIPDYLKTSEISSCIDHANEPISVIDMEALYEHVHSKDTSPSVPSLSVPKIDAIDPSTINRIRLFKAGEELFAFPEDGYEIEGCKTPKVIPFPLTPQYVKGLACQDGDVFPVVQMAQKMDLSSLGMSKQLLTCSFGGERFGFSVDEDLGVISQSDFTLRMPPPISEFIWISAFALHGGQIIPIIDPAGFLCPPDDQEQSIIPLPDRYTPDSLFDTKFQKEEVEVIEFDLLGARHAIPKSEIGDVLPFGFARKIPCIKSILTGVVEYQDDVVPVLDLSMLFGRRSLPTPHWSMILVQNGDFKAFVITETVHEERQLSYNVQRNVPVSLSQKLIYGCYPAGDAVRLVLNVEAIAVYFDKFIVKEFIAAMTKAMASAPAEIIPALLPNEELARIKEEELAEAVAAPVEEEVPAEPEEVAEETAEEPIIEEAVEEDEFAETISVPVDEVPEESVEEAAKVAEEPIAEVVEEEDIGEAVDDDEISAEIEQEVDEAEEEPITEAQEEEEFAEAIPVPLEEEEVPAELEEDAEEVTEEPIIETVEEEDLVEVISVPVEEDEVPADPEEYTEEATEEPIIEAIEEEEFAEVIPIPIEEEEVPAKLEEDELAEDILVPVEEEKIPAEPVEEAEETGITDIDILSKEETDTDPMAVELEKLSALKRKKHIERKKHKKLWAIVLLLLALLLLIGSGIYYSKHRIVLDFVNNIMRSAGKKEPQETIIYPHAEQEKRPTISSLPETDRKESFKDMDHAPEEGETGVVDEPEGLEEQEIPVSSVLTVDEETTEGAGIEPIEEMEVEPEKIKSPDIAQENVQKVLPVLVAGKKKYVIMSSKKLYPDSQLYTVKKGDTLWGIAKQFTGDPFNFPLVAKENEIHNPDLIYPNQKIYLKMVDIKP